MPFKPPNVLRPASLKSFTHGYAQSLLAGYQTSSVTRDAPFHTQHNNVSSYFQKPGLNSYQSQNAHSQNFNSTGTGAGASASAGSSSTHDVSSGDKALDAYYAAWQKHHRPEDKEWHQFQFAKRIGWKAPTTIPEPSAKPEENVEVQSSASVGIKPALVRSQSTSALDGIIKPIQSTTATETVAIRQDAEFIAGEIDRVTSEKIAAATTASTVDSSAELGHSDIAEVAASLSDATVSQEGYSTRATSITDADFYSQNLVELANNQRYAEIPATFQSMLIAGVTPAASAYNALLLAAINLPKGKHQVVLKVLEVYSDMVKRRVAPETSTYAILLEVLATRALDVMTGSKALEVQRVRHNTTETAGEWLFRSDQTESKILAEDDSLDLAVRLFDTSAAVATKHVYPNSTYQLLISACAEAGRIGDMVRIYADMESQGLRPSSAMFAPMIDAFAKAGDLRSAVECYDEYKSLAIAHDNGEISISRTDEDIYAAVVSAYASCGKLAGGLKFLGRIQDTLEGSANLQVVRDTIGIKALLPQWLKEDAHAKALEYANASLSSKVRGHAYSAICIDAADKNVTDFAIQAFEAIGSDSVDVLEPAAAAVMTMQLRANNLSAASLTWKTLVTGASSPDTVVSATMYVLSQIHAGEHMQALRECRQVFSNIRLSQSPSAYGADRVDRIDEALESLCTTVLQSSVVPPVETSMELLWMMTENGHMLAPLAERLLASLGPEEVNRLAWEDLNLLAQVQAGLLTTSSLQDVAHVPRFAHVLDLIATSGANLEQRTTKLIEQALAKIDRPDLASRWQARQTSVQMPLMTPTFQPAAPTPAYDDMYDPYASSTDFKGSAVIAEELEKTYGRHATHLNEALTRFRNMRRTGRHPRYITYAKLITAAAKENRVNLAAEILAMAKQDIPLVPGSRVVRHGWVSILDSMVGACLSVGRRDMASQYHQELSAMGAAPSANTFGLYITTLKESTKTFDEATEAVKIFHQAKSEGIEPSSFLYNALIGKLGKARRIDDCLFYFAEMRGLGIRPTSVTYGTIVNALCRVSDDKFAEELFEEMESMSNYKPRPAPYNSLMQYFLTTKRDRSKVLDYYQRMKANKIQPTMHTYKLLIDTHATLEPVDMAAAESVLEEIQATGALPEAVHYASLIHAKGCVLHDVAAARKLFDSVISEGRILPQPALYQALFEGMVANHEVAATEPLLQQMDQQRVAMTPYIANTLIHGWAMAKNVDKARAIFDSLGRDKREPSTYEAMTRAYLAAEEHGLAKSIVGEALRRGYPAAVANKICELVSGGPTRGLGLSA